MAQFVGGVQPDADTLADFSGVKGSTYTFDRISSFAIFAISFPNFLSFFCLIRILLLA